MIVGHAIYLTAFTKLLPLNIYQLLCPQFQLPFLQADSSIVVQSRTSDGPDSNSSSPAAKDKDFKNHYLQVKTLKLSLSAILTLTI